MQSRAMTGKVSAVLAAAALLGASCRTAPRGVASGEAGPVEMPARPAVLPYRVSPGDVLAVAFFLRPPSADSGAYRVDCMDVLSVRVIGETAYQADVTVRPDGDISFFMVGDVTVRGRTVDEIRRLLADRLSQRIPASEVSVILKQGRVMAETFMNTLMSNRDQGAARTVRVKHDGLVSFPLVGDVMVTGSTQTELAAELDERYGRLFGGALSVSVNVLQGDQGVVAVLGEVLRPGVYRINDAVDPVLLLALAGGAGDRGDIGRAVLVRRDDEGRITQHDAGLDVTRPGRRPRLLAAPGDILVVPRTTVANVNLFVEQYIRRMLPFSTSAGAYYNLNRE